MAPTGPKQKIMEKIRGGLCPGVDEEGLIEEEEEEGQIEHYQ
jgi:hypothetical protein